MASNYEKEPIYVLERTWDDSTKLPEKYKFQGSGPNKSMKAEVCIDSGTLGMEFFLDRTLPQFNQAGSRLDWSWPEAFLEFENVLGDSYRTTWQEVLAEHFPEPLGEEATSHRETKDDFDRAVAFFIKKTLNNEKPRDLQYIYMQPGGDYRLTKDLVTPPRLHAQRFKEMLRVAELLPAGDFPKPSEALALQWYYMSYHKSNRKKYVLSGKTLKDATFKTVTTFFQALYEQKKGDGSLEREEVERLKKRLLRQAAEGVRSRLRVAADDRRTHRARRELARRDDRRRYDVERGRDRRRDDDDRIDNDRRHLRGSSKRHRDDHRSDRGRDRGDRNNQPSSRRSASAGRPKGKGGAPPCMLHSWPDRPAKHTWAECSENPANKKPPPPKREQAYYAHDTRRPASDGPSDDEHRTEAASDDDGEWSRGSRDSRRSYSSRDDGEDNYAVDFLAPRKRAKPNPSARKKREYIAASDDSGGNGTSGSNKKGKLKDPLYLSDSD